MASKELKMEIEVLAQAHDLFNVGTFPGHVAKQVLMAQGYLKAVYEGMKAQARQAEEALAAEMAPTPKQVEETRAVAAEKAS